MPIYEYVCGQCGHQLEKLQKISDSPLEHCSECGKASLQKQISAAGFQLKGTGWYVTDFKNKKPAQEKNQQAEGNAETKKVSQAQATSSSDT